MFNIKRVSEKEYQYYLDARKKQKQREAWRVYAAALLPVVEKEAAALTKNGIDVFEFTAHKADRMLAEENKRFGGDDAAG